MPTSNQASSQALLGFDHKLTHLDGHNITLSRKGVTQPGRWNPPVRAGWCSSARTGFVDVIRGEGMPVFGSGSHGNLYIEYKVILPLELSPKMRKSKSLPPLMMNLVSIPTAPLRTRSGFQWRPQRSQEGH